MYTKLSLIDKIPVFRNHNNKIIMIKMIGLNKKIMKMNLNNLNYQIKKKNKLKILIFYKKR
jgi:hypothetical protein